MSMRSKKPVRFFMLLLAIALSGLSACLQSPDCFREDVFCAGLVTNSSGIKDFGLNQHTWEGLQEARRLDIADHVAYIESVDSRDYFKNIEEFAKHGYDVVITIGPAMDDETLQAADQYPDSVYIGMDQPHEETRPNVLPIIFPEDQMGFWAGALAARITRTGTVGAACETSGLDSMWRYCEGFRKGVAYVDEDVQALVVYRDNRGSETLFIDEEWGRLSAQELVEQGADVVFAAGGGTAQAALLAAAEMGARVIGAERDQARALPETAEALVTSIYGGARLEVQNWMRFIQAESVWEGNQIGGVEHASYSSFESQVSESLKSEMDELLESLYTGILGTEVPQSAP
ncbi:MAG: BMP family ABC transporter substrate-binding protein [Chloroflexota bacterium]